MINDHWHCPYNCDRPQKFADETNILICGECWFLRNERVEMLLCTPEICEGEVNGRE